MSEELLSPSNGLSNSKLSPTTAAVGNVLSGKTFYSGNKTLKTGTMVNRGTWNSTVAAGGSVTIPAGYHSGSGKVTAGNRTLNRKAVSFAPGTNSGSKTYNVVSSFGIPSSVATTLTANNFVASVITMTWPRDDASANNITLYANLSYNASSQVLTISYNSNYTETRFGTIYVYAFYVS